MSDSAAQADLPWLILFDGSCNLCNTSVRFILKRDSRRRFKFCSSTTPEGAALAAKHGFTGPSPGSMVLLVGETCYVRSTAALEIARRLDGVWPMLYVFILVPRGLRDWVYKQIAANRHRWFGTATECAVLPADRRADGESR